MLAISPVVYHATHSANLAGLLDGRRILSPNAIQEKRGTTASTLPRRSRGKGAGPAQFKVPLGERTIHLCDHDLLREGNIFFEPGWDLRRFIGRLNALVFFWPGAADGPIDQGRAHWHRYAKAGENFAVLRILLGDLIEVNGPPLLSQCNSGAPRHNPISGRQPRGGSTFVPLDAFPSAGNVVEVVFETHARLPASVSVARSYDGPWEMAPPR